MTTIRSVTVTTNNGSSPTTTVVTPSDATAAQVGDVLLIVHGNDYYPFANMPSPTVTPTATVVPVPDGSADAGDTGAHIKGYTATVATAGAQTVSVTETGSADEEKSLVVYVLADADAANPVDDAAGIFGASATPQPAPAVVPGTADALLICHVNSGGGASTASYTTPGGMTEQYEIHVGGLSGVGASEQLVAAGSTGTRTFTAATSVAWAAVSIAIRSAAGGGDTDADAEVAPATAAAQDAATSVTAGAEVASATGAANSPTARVAPNATAALGVGEALFEPGASISLDVIADNPIEMVGVANDVTATVAPLADLAPAAGAAHDSSAAVSVPAGLASGAAAALDATAETASAGTGLAEVATASAAALGATALAAPSAGAGEASAAAQDAVVVVAVEAAAEAATASAMALDSMADVAVLAAEAEAVATALDATGPGVPVPEVSAGVMAARTRRGAQVVRRERVGARMGAA